MKWEYKLSLGIVGVILIIFGGLLGGAIGPLLFGYSDEFFWISFGVGSFLGLFVFLLILDLFDVITINPRYWGRGPPKPKDAFWGQGYERVDEVVVKDDYKDLDWLRHQYYEVGRTIQDIASEQGVSMMTIRNWLDKHKVCPNCGSLVSNTLKFCGKCGELLNNLKE